MRRLIAIAVTAGIIASSCAADSRQVGSTSTTGPTTTVFTTSTTAPTSTTSTSTTTTTLPTTVGPGGEDLAGLPPVALLLGASDEAGPRIVLVDAARGSVVRVLAGENALGEGAGDLAASPDGATLYFSRILTSCSSEIVALDITDGSMKPVAGGEVPTPSPDGRYLAYVVDPVCRRGYDLVVRDVETGAERVWQSELPDDDTELVARIPALSWSPDGTQIAFELVLEDGIETRILDVTGTGGDLTDSTKLAAPDAAFWTSPLFTPDGALGVVELCCDFDDVERRLVLVDVVSGGAEAMYSSGDLRNVHDIDPTTGVFLLLVDRDDASSAVVALIDGRAVLLAEHAADAAFTDFSLGS